MAEMTWALLDAVELAHELAVAIRRRRWGDCILPGIMLTILLAVVAFLAYLLWTLGWVGKVLAIAALATLLAVVLIVHWIRSALRGKEQEPPR